MKGVFATANLPLVNDLPGLRASILRCLNDLATAVNNAAVGRLQEFVSVTGSHTCGEGEHVIQVAPSAPCAITLAAPGPMRGVTVTVKRTNGTTHTITVSAATGNIDGSPSMTLTTAYQARRFFSDGTQWWEHP